METVLFVCHAGASSQFLVQRLSVLLSDEPFTLRAASLSSLAAESPALVVIGPPLATEASNIRASLPTQAIFELSADAYADHSGNLAATEIRQAFAKRTDYVHTPKGESHHG